MDIETVINARMWDGFWDFFTHRYDIAIFWFLGTVFLYFIVLGIVIGSLSEEHSSKEDVLSFSAVFAILVGLLSFLIFLGSYDEYNPKNWEKEYAIPFMESLPYSSEEIGIISVKETSTSEYYIEYAVEENGKTVIESVVAPVSKELDKGESPILRFQYLEKTLIADTDRHAKYQRGRHNVSLLVPRDFTFDR